jgi:signal transduction histidine kinase
MSDDFAARIGALRLLGHELRTPLTLIQGYLSLFQDDDLASEQRRAACALMREQCAEMNRLIDTFLDEESEQEHLALASSQVSPAAATRATPIRRARR